MIKKIIGGVALGTFVISTLAISGTEDSPEPLPLGSMSAVVDGTNTAITNTSSLSNHGFICGFNVYSADAVGDEEIDVTPYSRIPFGFKIIG